jgi:hypothetical protein
VKKTCRIIQSTIEKKAADQSSTGEYRTYSSSSDPVTSPANPINSVWEIRETPLEIGSFNFVKIGNVFFPSDSKGNVLQEKALTRSEYSFRFSNKLMSHLLYPCPKTVITLGKPFVIENHARWTPSKSIQQACAVSVVLSGDSKVVEFRAKREMDTPEYLNTVRSVLSSLENRLWASNEERNKATNTVNERIKFIEQHGSSKYWKYTCYTDTQNGLSLHCETSESETYRWSHQPGSTESELLMTVSTLFQCVKDV